MCAIVILCQILTGSSTCAQPPPPPTHSWQCHDTSCLTCPIILQVTYLIRLFINPCYIVLKKSLWDMGIAILTGGQCRQKCLFGYTWLIQSRLIELGLRDMQCLFFVLISSYYFCSATLCRRGWWRDLCGKLCLRKRRMMNWCLTISCQATQWLSPSIYI